MRAVRAAWTRWTGIPNRKEFSWGEWPFCLLGAFTRTCLLGRGLRIRLGSCSRLSTEGKRNPARLLVVTLGLAQQIGKLRGLASFTSQVKFLRKQIEVCTWRLTGASSQQHCDGAREPGCFRSQMGIHTDAAVALANLPGSCEAGMAI